MNSYDGVLGYLKYSGKLVEEGYFDARKSANALVSFDEAIRYFIKQEFVDLEKLDYEIPVKVREGSWEIVIPDSIGMYILGGAGIVTTAYLSSAAGQIAKNDFNEVSIKKIFSHSLACIQWFIRIGKHLGHLKQKKFSQVKFRNDNKQIGIPNSNMEYLYVPKVYLDQYSITSSKLLTHLAQLIEAERQLTVGIIEDNYKIEETININDKYIFFEDEQDEVLFPELTHGMEVRLEGDITRGNENVNNLGFRYDGHIITIIPVSGSIVRHKNTLFLKCLITGRVTRKDKFGGITEKRPKIIYYDIAPIEKEQDDYSLF